ncbi:MAG: Fur family transcriptional regulator [Bdellovibrionota bacterium]|nr:Fur family transcriptional regulator [Bdellovibrionota bacterium]
MANNEVFQKPKVYDVEQSEIELKNIIRDIGLKVTSQRLTILRSLINGRDHVTAQELFENVSQIDNSLGFATVYRFLRTLAENKLVTEVRMGGLPARYEWTKKKSHHDHITCSECGKICEFENLEIEKLQAEIAKSLGFILTDHVLELYGVCSDCQASKGILPGSKSL